MNETVWRPMVCGSARQSACAATRWILYKPGYGYDGSRMASLSNSRSPATNCARSSGTSPRAPTSFPGCSSHVTPQKYVDVRGLEARAAEDELARMQKLPARIRQTRPRRL
jgi:hypothetical protein